MTDTQAKPRPLIAAKERGPGPGRYALPSTLGTVGHDATKKHEPAFTFGSSLPNPMFRKTIGPGPAYAIEPSVNRYGKDGTPKYSVGGRVKELATDKTPAPGAYSPEKTAPLGEKKAPSYTMGARTKLRKRDAVPAPNTYSLPVTVGDAPKYSMTARSNRGGFAEDLAKAPAPGQYNVPAPDANHTKAPAFTMQSRTFMPTDATKKPGPGAHSPEKVNVNKPSAPKYTLGSKHSEYITPLIIDVPD